MFLMWELFLAHPQYMSAVQSCPLYGCALMEVPLYQELQRSDKYRNCDNVQDRVLRFTSTALIRYKAVTVQEHLHCSRTKLFYE